MRVQQVFLDAIGDSGIREDNQESKTMNGWLSFITCGWYEPRRPLARHRKNPNEYHQARLIRRAEFKRKMRATERTFREIESWGRNPTIDHIDPRRNPRHIAY